MKSTLRRPTGKRGSIMLVALVLAAGLALGLTGYLAVTRSSLTVAQRTFHFRDALGLAEAGLEEALDSFHQADAGATQAEAWAGWTLSAGNATRTLVPFDRDGRALVTVKIFVSGYDGSTSNPFAISQASLVPFDRTPSVVRTVQIALTKEAFFFSGLVARQGLTWSGQTSANSFHSKPDGSSRGNWLRYSDSIARGNTRIIVPSGTINLGSLGRISGDLVLGADVKSPGGSKVSGQITNGATDAYPMPAYPQPTSVSQSYNLGTNVGETLPRSGHKPAADGRYYYFSNGANIANVKIAENKAVTIVGTNTRMGGGIEIQKGASLTVYMDGVINTGNNGINTGDWSGALQVFTSTSGNCTLGGDGSIYACIYAPNANLTINGGKDSGGFVGSILARTVTTTGHMDFHFDEALRLPSAGSPWKVTGWYELDAAADRAALATRTSNFLR